MEAFGSGHSLCVLVVRDGADIIGIAPLWRYQDYIRKIPLRKIGFISCPDTPFADFVIEDERRSEVLKVILEYLYHEKQNAWDILSLSPWPDESMNYQMFQSLLVGGGKRFYTGIASLSPYIQIQGEWDSFLGNLSVKFRKTHRNICNRIKNMKQAEIVNSSQYSSSESLMSDILSVSEKSWKHKNGISIASRMETKKFFEMLTERAGRMGRLFVWLLKVDRKPIAIEYDVECSGIVHALRADYDGSYREISPGAYLEYMIVKHLFENGYKEYNTGPGLRTYKLHWTDRMRTNISLTVCNSNLKGNTVWALENKIIPLLRQIRDKNIRAN